MSPLSLALLGCATCIGGGDSPLAQSAKAGVLVLLAIIVLVLGGIASVAIYWTKRARMLEASEAFDAQPLVALKPRA